MKNIIYDENGIHETSNLLKIENESMKISFVNGKILISATDSLKKDLCLRLIDNEFEISTLGHNIQL